MEGVRGSIPLSSTPESYRGDEGKRIVANGESRVSGAECGEPVLDPPPTKKEKPVPPGHIGK
jgi:hypothetical protein